jgi:predicted ester cyclase
MIRASLTIAAIILLTAPALAQTEALTAPLADYPAVRAFYDAFNAHDASGFDRALDQDWTSTPSQKPGREPFKQMIKRVFQTFPDLHFRVEDVVARGDRVAVRTTGTGTQAGEFVGIPATNRSVTFQTIDIHRVEGDRIIETWHVEDWLSVLFQLGALPLKQH